MLPPPPRVLRLHANRLGAEQALERQGVACRVRDADVTFDELFAGLGALPGWRALDAWGSRFLLRSLLLASRGRLRSAAQDAWGVRAVHHALAELRLAGVQARQLDGGEPSAELRDLSGLLGAYEDILHSQQGYDTADQQRQAVLDVVLGNVPEAWRHIERVEVMVGTELFGARLDVLNAFAARGVRVSIVLPWDDTRPAAFAWPEAMLHSLEARGHQTLSVQYDNRVGEGPMAPLRAAQFGQRRISDAPVCVVQVSDGEEHRQQILAQVGRWLRAGVPAHAVAVVCEPALAQALVQHLARANITAFCRRGAPLAHSRAAQLMLQALRVTERGLPREAVLELWTACGKAIETADGVWSTRRVAATLRRLGLRTCAPGHIRAALATDTARPAPASQSLDTVAHALDTFVGRLVALPEAGDIEAYVAGLVPFLAEAAHEAQADAAAAAAFVQVRQGLLQLTQAARAVPGGVQLTRAELADWLAVMFDESRQAPPGSRSGAVRIMSPEELLGTHFDCVLFAGANVGVFPRSAPADPVLTDALRHAINARVGPRLVQYGPLLGRAALPGDARDTWLWLEILASAQRELVVTVTCAPGEEDAGPSELVDELLRSTHGVMAAPPASYADPAPACLALWLQTWAYAHPQRGLAGAAALPWSAVDAALAQHAQTRHARLSAGLSSLWDRTAQGGRLAALGPAARAVLHDAVSGAVHSTSRLDALGMCRYRHFASAILRLGTDDVPTLSANPREQGSVAHAALHSVYADLRARGGLQAARLQPQVAMHRAHAVFWENTDAYLVDVRVHALLQQAALLHAWQAVQTQLSRDLAAPEGEPVALEYRFDDRAGADAPELALPHPRGGPPLRIRGSIDRIDRVGTTLVTLDYKRTVSTRSAGRHFQLAIYSAVAHRDIDPAATAVGAAWLGLWDGRRRQADDLVGPPAEQTAVLSDTLWARVDGLLAGDITPDPDGDALCMRCDFAPLCRYPAEGVTDAEECL